MLIVSFPGPHQASLQCCNKRWAGTGNEAGNINELEGFFFWKKNIITPKCNVQSLTKLKAVTCGVNKYTFG